jgi:hypothetical protein
MNRQLGSAPASGARLRTQEGCLIRNESEGELIKLLLGRTVGQARERRRRHGQDELS